MDEDMNNVHFSAIRLSATDKKIITNTKEIELYFEIWLAP